MREFEGRVVVPGTCKARALVSKKGFNTLASFQKSLLKKDLRAICSDQNNQDLFGKEMAKMALCLPQTIGSTTGGMVLFSASAMGAAPACLLFSKSIDSLAAAGAILSDVWTEFSLPTVDRLGDEFLEFVKDGMTVEILPNGKVLISE
ncbi:MAG: DUF126 domain-containing protein [Anaerolineaceae bacterium]|nr:DUF126 domain-containing protein [Anaerolineaceae bacterium]